jgi:uncharacterized protein (TIGR02058 family)
MDNRRFVIELGMGADLHGGDVTKAARRAVKDAVSRSCLCGLWDIFRFDHPDRMRVRLKVAVPFPDRLDRDQVKASVPFGSVELEVVSGGLETEGLDLPLLGPGDRIVVALASLTVLVDLELHPVR